MRKSLLLQFLIRDIFDGWYRSTGEKVSENDKYIFNVDGNISLTAHFIKDGEQEANKEELENLYNTNKDILEDKYTPESWLIFKNALDNAKLVLENEDATQEQVNEAISNLNEAISNLVYKSEASEVDKSKLQELINKAEEIDTSNYTKESINIFNDKLKEGKDVLNNEKATQEEVDEAAKKLQFALDNLELIKDDQDTGNNGSENNSNGNNGSENNVNENDNGGKDNNSDNLPSTGGTSSVTVGVIALMITGTGIVLRRKR